MTAAQGSESAYVPGYNLLNDLHTKEVSGRCMTAEVKRVATLTGVDEVSGWYGPGAYLAWLVTAYVAAFSSIWHSKCAREPKAARKTIYSDDEVFMLPRLSSDDPADALDGEMVAELMYPLVAVADVFVRLVRLQDRCADERSGICAVFGAYGVWSDVKAVVAGGRGGF